MTAKLLVATVVAPVVIAGHIVFHVGKGILGFAGGFWRQKRASVHGDADWASDKELKKRGHFEPGGIPVGVTKSKKRIYAHPESSVLMVAPKRQGKTSTFIAILKSLRERKDKPDLLIHDPAGDIHKATLQELGEMGYQVGIIDLYNPALGGKYDPLSYPNALDHYAFDRDVRSLCELIVPDDVGSKQPHFAEFSRLLFREIVTAAIKFDGNTKSIADCVSDLVNKAKLDKLVATLRLRNDPDIMSAISTFEKMYGKPEGNSMLSTSLRKLEIWRLAAIREVAGTGTSSDPLRPRGWTFDDMIEAPYPVALFIRTGLGTGAGEFARLAMGNAINTVRRHWNETGTRLRKGLWVIVDEARVVGNCNAVMDANNELGKAGVNVLICFLSLADVHKTYPDATTLISGCELIAFGGAKEREYYEEVSKLLGDRTDVSLGESKQEGRKGETSHQVGVPLLRPDALRRMPYDEAVVVMNDLNVRCHKLFSRGKNRVAYH